MVDCSPNLALVVGAEKIGQEITAIRHVNQVYAGHHLEKLTHEMRRKPGTLGREVYLARIGFGVSDELGNGFGRQFWIDHHHKGAKTNHGDRRNVADEIETEIGIERSVDRT